MKNNELKPCPFCGNLHVEEEITFSEIWIECRGCGASTTTLGDLEISKCRHLWNTRPIENDFKRQLAEAHERVKELEADIKRLKPKGMFKQCEMCMATRHFVDITGNVCDKCKCGKTKGKK